MHPAWKRPAPPRSRLARAAYWSFPSLVLFSLYASGLRSSYFRDDFAWLGLASRVHDLPSLMKALFQPFAQGSIRPLSERLLFLAAWNLFGMDALPLRLLVFATAAAMLVMLCAVTRRITGSDAAGFAAPLLWIANANIYLPLVWTAAYNQILCALTLLTALYFFVRYTQTGSRRDCRMQWAAFLFGFLVLELNVVYPALALLYAVCCARDYASKTLPLFAVSLVYAIVHRAAAPEPVSDVYRMYFDSRLFATLWRYIEWSAGGAAYAMYRGFDAGPLQVAQMTVLATLAAFTAWMLYRRRWLALFFAGWFFLVLAPVLPLRNHLTHYYLTIPLIGLAMLGAWGIATALRSRSVVLGMAAFGLALAYATPSAWAGRGMARETSAISRRAGTFVRSLAAAQQLHKGKPLLVSHLDAQLYWSAWHDNPFPLIGVERIYMTEESAAAIDPKPPQRIRDSILPDVVAAEALAQREVVAYSVLEDGRLRNDTLLFRASVPLLRRSPLPAYVRAADPLAAPLLHQGWYSPDRHFRWTSQSALVRLRGPSSTPSLLSIDAYCPAPMNLSVSVNGEPIARRQLMAGRVELEAPLPAALAGKPSIAVRLDLDRTVQAGSDPRRLGLAVASVEVRP